MRRSGGSQESVIPRSTCARIYPNLEITLFHSWESGRVEELSVRSTVAREGRLLLQRKLMSGVSLWQTAMLATVSAAISVFLVREGQDADSLMALTTYCSIPIRLLGPVALHSRTCSDRNLCWWLKFIPRNLM